MGNEHSASNDELSAATTTTTMTTATLKQRRMSSTSCGITIPQENLRNRPDSRQSSSVVGSVSPKFSPRAPSPRAASPRLISRLPPHPVRELPSIPSFSAEQQRRLGGGGTIGLLHQQGSNSNLLSPSHRAQTANRRRMSVAGDQEVALRRELARADGVTSGGGGGGTGSGGQTPQRRFSRANANGGGGGGTRKLSSIRMITGDDMIGSAETSLAEQLKLTNYQLQILHQSWPKIRSQGTLGGVFRDLAQTNTSVKEMFQKMSIVEGFSSLPKGHVQDDHVRMLVELIEFALQNLKSPSKAVQQKCHVLGEQHFSVFGSSNEAKIWDDFGESISKCLAKAESVRGKREAFRAWMTLITFMVDSMRVGYVQNFKRRSLTRHSSNTQLTTVQLATLEEIQSTNTTTNRTTSPKSRRDKRSITPIPHVSAMQL